MAEEIAALLLSSPLMSGMEPELAVVLAGAGKSVGVDENEPLFFEGDDAHGFYVIESGGLKATRLSPEGLEQLIAVFSVGDVIGEMAIFDDSPRSATITGLKSTRLIHWSKSSFFRIADAHPSIYRHLLRILSGRLRATNDALAARHFLPLTGQLAQAMLRLKSGFGLKFFDGSTRIAHKLTQAELAAMIGASRENVSRVLNTWKREGLISRVEGYYHIIDQAALEKLGER